MEVRPRSDEAGRATITQENTRTNTVDIRAVGRFPTGAEAGVEVHMLKGGTLRVQQELQSWDCVQVFRRERVFTPFFFGGRWLTLQKGPILRAAKSPQSHLRRLGAKLFKSRQGDKEGDGLETLEYCHEWQWNSNTDHYYETPDHYVFSRVIEVSKYLTHKPTWSELNYKFEAEVRQ